MLHEQPMQNTLELAAMVQRRAEPEDSDSNSRAERYALGAQLQPTPCQAAHHAVHAFGTQYIHHSHSLLKPEGGGQVGQQAGKSLLLQLPAAGDAASKPGS